MGRHTDRAYADLKGTSCIRHNGQDGSKLPAG